MTVGTVLQERGQDSKVICLQDWAEKHGKYFCPVDPSIVLRDFSKKRGVKKEDILDLKDDPQAWEDLMNEMVGFDIQDLLAFTQTDDELLNRIEELFKQADKLFEEIVCVRWTQVTSR